MKEVETVEVETNATIKVQYKIRPLHGWVLIRKVSKELEKVGDLYIDKSQARSQRGIIEAISDGETLLKVGHSCIYTNFPLELEDVEEVTGIKDLQLVRREEIYGVIEAQELC
jgi:hypothetical protein